jgi:hypothetical protein
MSGRIILSAPDEKEIEDHRRALREAGLNEEQFFALRAPWNPDNTARDELVFMSLVAPDYVRTKLGDQRLAAYWDARFEGMWDAGEHRPDRTIVDIVWD